MLSNIDPARSNPIILPVDKIKDKYGRTFQTIRLSLLPLCNFECVYCRLDDGYSKIRVQKPEYFIEIIKKINKIIPIKKIHLTGGEPTLYPYLDEVILGLKSIDVKEISITTNGTLLLKQLFNLKKVGLNSINLSLDALDDMILKKMGTKKDIEFYKILIDEILNLKIPLKINSTIIKGYNDNQILPLLEYAGERKITIRFLEYMKMGIDDDLHKKRFFSMSEILNTIQMDYKIYELPREIHSTAYYWITNTNYKFGIIANHSKPFCMDCDRLRIDSSGKIYGCITQDKGIPVNSSDSDIQIQNKLKIALENKQLIFNGSNHKMHFIGG